MVEEQQNDLNDLAMDEEVNHVVDEEVLFSTHPYHRPCPLLHNPFSTVKNLYILYCSLIVDAQSHFVGSL